MKNSLSNSLIMYSENSNWRPKPKFELKKSKITLFLSNSSSLTPAHFAQSIRAPKNHKTSEYRA